MERINFEDGQLVKAGYVEIDGVQHEVHEAEYSSDTPLSAFVFDKLQDNIETEINTHIEHKYTQILTANLSTQEITLPCKYKVGINVLDVYCNGIKLIKANAADTEGHYYEVGASNSISNTIKISTDWYNDAEQRPTVGDVFEFVIRGEYQ